MTCTYIMLTKQKRMPARLPTVKKGCVSAYQKCFNDDFSIKSFYIYWDYFFACQQFLPSKLTDAGFCI